MTNDHFVPLHQERERGMGREVAERLGDVSSSLCAARAMSREFSVMSAFSTVAQDGSTRLCARDRREERSKREEQLTKAWEMALAADQLTLPQERYHRGE